MTRGSLYHVGGASRVHVTDYKHGGRSRCRPMEGPLTRKYALSWPHVDENSNDIFISPRSSCVCEVGENVTQISEDLVENLQ